jgi:hypothetical protein
MKKTIAFLITVCVGFCMIALFISKTTKSVDPDKTEILLSKEIFKDLKVSGCVILPNWDLDIPPIQVCELTEARHRGWIYNRESVDKRIEERLND